MAIDKETQAEIIRLYTVEKWPVGTIATHYGIHHSVVTRVIGPKQRNTAPSLRPRKVDPYLSFIKDNLEQNPTIAASRLFSMIRERGYTGQQSQFRSIIHEMRPRRREAFLRLTRLPGEEAQVDWGHFGSISCQGFERPLVCCVITLAYSRAIFMRFYVSQAMSSLLDAHERAFAWFTGIPRTCLYDNMKSIVQDRHGNAIKFNPVFMEYVQHSRFQVKVAAPARGNEKGRVERSIQYIRTSFFMARTFNDLHHLNEQALRWCETESLERRWFDDKRRSVGEVLQEERLKLLPLRQPPYPCEERCEASIGKTPYVRFDLNDYSVPHEYVLSIVTVFASPELVRIVSGSEVIATHPRCFGRGKTIHDPAHLEALRKQKHQARVTYGSDFLSHFIPAAPEFIKRLMEQEYSVHRARRDLQSLLRLYGAEQVQLAITESMAGSSPSLHHVRRLLEAQRQQDGRTPALPLVLPESAAQHDIVPVKQHDLSRYTALEEQVPADTAAETKEEENE